VKVDDCAEVATVLVGSSSVTEGAEIVDVDEVAVVFEDELHAAIPRIASIKTVERMSFMRASSIFCGDDTIGICEWEFHFNDAIYLR
jgi:hypothetical protein